MAEVPQLRSARLRLARRDPVMKRLIASVGPCTLHFSADRFAALVRIIISQQISTKAAQSIHDRLLKICGTAGATPSRLLDMHVMTLREAGLSGSKTRCVRDLAEKVHSGELSLDQLDQLTDDEVISRLTPVRGVGPWTAQMVLIFSLGRLDVLPTTDFGLRAGVRNHYGLVELPSRAELEAIAAPWQPYRTIGTWYVWKSAGFVPQSVDGD